MRLPLIFIAFLILGCKNSTSSSEDQMSGDPIYYFDKEDSVVVDDVIARVFLFQGHSEDKYIFRDMASSEVYVYDREGRLLDRWNKEGDVPGKFSMASSNLSFDSERNLVLIDIMNGIKVLKRNSEVIQDHRIFRQQISLGSRISLFDTQQLIKKEGKEYLIYSLDLIEEYEGNYDQAFLAERKNLLITDLETNETRKLIPFPAGSQYLNGKVYFFRDMRPVFHYDENLKLLYLMFQSEPVLYKYDWSGETPKLIETQRVNLNGFETHEGFEVGSVDMGEIGSFKERPYPSDIVDVTKYGEDLMISYIPTPQDKGVIDKVAAGNASEETKKLLREQTQMKTVLLKPTGEVVSVDIPEMHYSSFKVNGDRIYWMKKAEPGTEAEEFTLYWGKLGVK